MVPRLGLVVVLTVAGAFPSAVGAESSSCPEPQSPKTCASYAFLGQQAWRLAPDGTLTLDYVVNPTQPWMPEADAVAAIRVAFSTWEAWNPKLRFRYMGVTRLPAIPFDGVNTIDWLNHSGGAAATWVYYHPADQGHIYESDVSFSTDQVSGWLPCEQMDGSCTDGRVYHPTYHIQILDVQSIMTHEIGHMIGLDHVEGIEGTTLTMTNNQNRTWSTLGLGDVLGAKARVPWTCPPAGQPIPAAYSRVCPTIQIFVP